MDTRWIKSSFSDDDDRAVRVAGGTGFAVGRVLVKDWSNGRVLAVPRWEWSAFIEGVKAGEFDDV